MRRRAVAIAAVAGGVAAGAAGVLRVRSEVRRARGRGDPGAAARLRERPGAEHRVRSFDGTDLAVHVAGPAEGPAVVFVHGFSLDLTAWHYQWTRFSRTHRCVLYDQRGHGRSGPAVGGDYTLQALGEDLRAVLDAVVGDGPAVVVGHSLGGMSVLAFADRHPEEFGARVAGVVLANTAAGDLMKAILGNIGARAAGALLPMVRRLAADPRRLYSIRRRALGGVADVGYLAARLTNFGKGAPPEVVEHAVALAAEVPPDVWIDLMPSLIELDLADALDSITVPTLLVAGDVDRLTPPSSAMAMKRRLHDASLVVMRGAGHCTMLERHEQFNDLLERFLTRVRTSAEAATGS